MAVGAFASTLVALNVAANGNSADIDVREYVGVTVDCNLTALTGGAAPTVQFLIDRKNSDGTYTQIATSTALSVVTTPPTGFASMVVGRGMSTATLSGVVIRIRWIVTGGPATAVATIYIQGETGG